MNQIRTVGIVGVGLIGASLGMALRERRLVDRVVGMDIDPQALEIARQRGAIDDAGAIEESGDVDLMVIAVPPKSVVETAVRAAATMRPGSILTDVASTKGAIVRELDERLPPAVRYVGGHPMAGSAGRGPAAADAGLFAGHPFLLTPTDRTDPAALQAMRSLAERLGMRPVLLTPDDHDELVAQVSHVPYLVAVAAVNAATADALPLHGPAFADVARVAASPAELWVEICRGNRTAITRALAGFRRELDRLEQALDDDASLRAALESSGRRARGS
ncbi:MAG: prephenate dehydrogenase [bacterium]